jgi:hypothetical protein
VLLARFDEAAATADPEGVRRFGVHLALARAAVAATDWPLAAAHVQEARRRVDPADPVRRARLDALDAVIALGDWHAHLTGRGVACGEIRDYAEPVPFSLFTFTDPDGVALELMYLAA